MLCDLLLMMIIYFIMLSFIIITLNGGLSDIREEYCYINENKKVSKPHDKIFKEILENKEEAVKFINEHLNLENTKNELNKNDIEIYNKEFIGENFSKTESDIIYKMKNQNIFFLIEHQSTIDYSMPYRILKYNMAIMDSAIDIRKIRNKDYRFPVIYSFVIYTGNRKWNVQNYIVKKQESLFQSTKEQFGNFQVVDINDYSNEELLKSNMLLSKVMLLEKAKNINDLENYIEEIIEEKLDKRQSDFLIRILNYILKDKISKEKFEEINNKLIKKEGEKVMFVQIINDWVDEMLAKEENIVEKEEKIAQKEENIALKEEKMAQKEENIARKEESIALKEEKMAQKEESIALKEEKMAQKEESIALKEEKMAQKEKSMAKEKENLKKEKLNIIFNMLNNNIDEKLILKITGINKKELDKIKNMLQ